jgi:aquaglyceroporin related protein, other eukaryote
MNPAISVSLSIFRGFPWRQCAIYVVAQFLASITAGALAFAVYADTIQHVDPSMENTSKTFFSTPQEWVSFPTAFVNQIVGSAIMMIAVFALGDDQNNPPGAGMHALVSLLCVY